MIKSFKSLLRFFWVKKKLKFSIKKIEKEIKKIFIKD